MKTIGIIYNARIPEALDLSSAIVNELSLEQDSWIAPAENLDQLRERVPKTDMVITAGGDGTILRAVKVTAPFGIPMVGINMGRLGFMTELRVDDALERLPMYLDGGCRVDEHNMVQARLFKGSNGSSEVLGPFPALNDVVVGRGSVSRVVTIRTNVDGADVASLRADGIILSTATGSTGYSLAVGGPILDPLSASLVLKPIAAHVGLSAALVLSPAARIKLYLEGTQEAILSVDGFVDLPLAPGDWIEVEQSPLKTKFLRANPANHFYATITRRLGFSIRGQGGLDRV
ncbi:MAG TPA: NAD(+)/NADH kinase [Dehalococcoidia bacterium]|nr:NAD(+)/NADH kinase [Dehalococcoidia bacterium]